MDSLNINNAGFAALQTAKVPPTLGNIDGIEKTREVAENFEAFFLGQMLQPMFQNIEAAEPFGGGSSEKMWKTMQVEEYGKAIAKSGGIGLADAVFREIIKTQELQ